MIRIHNIFLKGRGKLHNKRGEKPKKCILLDYKLKQMNSDLRNKLKQDTIVDILLMRANLLRFRFRLENQKGFLLLNAVLISI